MTTITSATPAGQKVTDTAIALASQFMQNTGGNILDSGGFYGRQYQRLNDAATSSGLSGAEYMLSRPEAHIRLSKPYKDGNSALNWVLADTFHVLNRHLTYSPEETELLRGFEENNPEEDDIAGKFSEFRGDYMETAYTYNYDNMFSTDFVYWTYEIDFETYVIISTHNGCDARTGFSQTKIYKYNGEFDYFNFSIELFFETFLTSCAGAIEIPTTARGDGFYVSFNSNRNSIYRSDIEDEIEELPILCENGYVVSDPLNVLTSKIDKVSVSLEIY